MSCEYCGDEPRMIWADTEVGATGLVSSGLYVFHSATRPGMLVRDEVEFMGCRVTVGSMARINFCPMCGRDLRKAGA